ncbi:MAG: hypothetical protein OXC19_00015, partial [Bryobacterales bacterium]|nr:hypothetical protein [Bryobacterales bacterium]
MLRTLLPGLLLAVPIFAQAPEFPINLRQGTMAGEVGETSVILQSRLTSSNPRQDPRWEGVRGAEGWARFEIADNEPFDAAHFTDWIEASPYSDFIVKLKINDL